MPTDTDLTIGGTKRLPTMHTPVVLEAVMDYTKNPSGTDDTATVINIPAGTTLVSLTANVETAEGSAATFDVGDLGADNQFLSVCSANDLGCTMASVASGEAYYSTANGITINSNTGLAAAIVRLTAMIYRSGAPD